MPHQHVSSCFAKRRAALNSQGPTGGHLRGPELLCGPRDAVTCMQTGNRVLVAVVTEAPEQSARAAERRRAAGRAGCAAGLLPAPEPAAAGRHVRAYK